MIWLVFSALFALWVVGLIGGIGGFAIHAFLFAALVLLVYQFAVGRRTTL